MVSNKGFRVSKVYQLVLIFFVCICSSTVVNGQVLISLLLGDKLNTGKIEFGLDGGLNYSRLTSYNQFKYRPNFNLGFYFDIKTKNPHWLFHTGVMVKSSVGANDLPIYDLKDSTLNATFKDGRLDRTMNYFFVPVLMKYRFDSGIFFEGGIQLGLRTKVKDVFTADKAQGEMKYTVVISDQYKRIDAGLSGGIGYHLMKGNGMNLCLNYYYGLTNCSADSEAPAQHNSTLYMLVGIPIGVGKAKAKGNYESK